MCYNIMRHKFRKSCILITTVLLVVLINPVNAEITDQGVFLPSSDYELEIKPLDYEVKPDYNDGVVGTPIEGFLNIVYWDRILPIHLGTYLDFFKNTQLGDFTRTVFVPSFSVIVGMTFLFFFSRRKNPEQNPESTPAKILAFVREHPGVSEKQIIDAVEKSRGSIAYQLRRLERDGKIRISQRNGRNFYFIRDGVSSYLEEEIQRIFANAETREIFMYLHFHPNQTCTSLAHALNRKVYSIRYYLRKMDSVISISGDKNPVLYSLSEDVQSIVSEMNIYINRV